MRNLRVLLGLCLPLSQTPSGITVKPTFPHSSHIAGNTPEEINETPKVPCASFFSLSKLETYFTHAQYLLLHIDCALVCEYKSAGMPRDKDLSVGYFQGPTIKEYLSLLCILPETEEHGNNVSRYGT